MLPKISDAISIFFVIIRKISKSFTIIRLVVIGSISKSRIIWEEKLKLKHFRVNQPILIYLHKLNQNQIALLETLIFTKDFQFFQPEKRDFND